MTEWTYCCDGVPLQVANVLRYASLEGSEEGQG